MYTFYTTWCDVQEDYGNASFPKIMTYGRLKYAWYAYVDLLDIDYSDGFKCSKCKDDIDVVICDGTSLSFRRKFLVKAPKEETKKAYETLQGR